MEYRLSDDTWDSAEYGAMERVMRSGYFTMGEEVRAYEQAFAQKMGARYAVMSNSGSSANLLAVAALCYSGRLQPGDEVIVPAVSWATTYFPLAQHRLKLKFVDIDIGTLNLDVAGLEAAVTEKTKAIFCVNLLGNANDFDAIMGLCERHQLLLLEDNCESLGGSYHGRMLGTFGTLGTYSTFYSHHLCTMEGGMTVTDDEELYHYLLCIRAHGWTRDLPRGSKLHTKNDNEFYESFHFIMPGYNLRPLELEAAVGREQLRKMDRIIRQRKKNAKYFLERMGELESYKTQRECGSSSWFGFAVVLAGRLAGARDKVVGRLREAGVEVRPIVAGNFTRMPAVRFLDYETHGRLPNADVIHREGFFVGNHCRDNRGQVDLLIELLKEFD